MSNLFTDFSPKDILGDGFGNGIGDSFGGVNGNTSNYDNGLAKAIESNTAATAANTSDLVGEAKTSDEILRTIRESTNKSIISKYTTQHVTVDMTGMVNTIGNNIEMQDVMNKISLNVATGLCAGVEGA